MMKKRVLSFLLALSTFVAILFVLAPVFVVKADAAQYSGWVFPVNNGGKVAYPYGYSSSYFNNEVFHDGLDLHTNGDENVYATFSGRVLTVNNRCPHWSCYPYKCPEYSTYGNSVYILSDDGELKAIYGHLKQHSICVSKGDYVVAGQKIAEVGSSGYSTGKHLHFSVKLAKTGKTVNVNKSNINYVYTGYGRTSNEVIVQYDANGGDIPTSPVVGLKYKVNTELGATVRVGPGVDQKACGFLPDGTSFVVTETKTSTEYTWGKIDYKGQPAYVALGWWMDRIGPIHESPFYVSGSLIFDENTGAPLQTVLNNNPGRLCSEAEVSLTRPGYHFLGWSISPNGEVIDCDEITAETVAPDSKGTSELVLYAQWKKLECAHVWGFVSYSEDAHRYCCLVCDVTTGCATHTFTFTVAQDSHTKACSECGYTTRSENHSFQWSEEEAPACSSSVRIGLCDCGYQTVETVLPQEDHCFCSWYVFGQSLRRDCIACGHYELIEPSDSDDHEEISGDNSVPSGNEEVTGDTIDDSNATVDDSNAEEESAAGSLSETPSDERITEDGMLVDVGDAGCFSVVKAPAAIISLVFLSLFIVFLVRKKQ